MKFIVDAQLPKKLANWIATKGYDAIHTLDLPQKNATQDLSIISLSVAEKRVVISKDSDFFDYYLLKGEPYKLLLISTGNITNKELMLLFEQNFDTLIGLLQSNKVLEINNKSIITHY